MSELMTCKLQNRFADVKGVKCCREEKIVFANATEPTGVAELSVLGSIAVALKIVVGVSEFSKCCEHTGFFRVLQYEILALRHLTPSSLGT